MRVLGQAQILTHLEQAIYIESHLPGFVWILVRHLYCILMSTVYMLDKCNYFVFITVCSCVKCTTCTSCKVLILVGYLVLCLVLLMFWLKVFFLILQVSWISLTLSMPLCITYFNTDERFGDAPFSSPLCTLCLISTYCIQQGNFPKTIKLQL